MDTLFVVIFNIIAHSMLPKTIFRMRFQGTIVANKKSHFQPSVESCIKNIDKNNR
jgi:hypothetical protein